MDLTFKPLTRDQWHDFTALFGENGACGGCWCMYWRLTRKVFTAQKGEGNRQAMKAIVESGNIPGLLAYHSAEPVGWCSVGPRDTYPVLSRSRILKPVDDKPCWSVSCLFIHKLHRKKGVATALLEAAVAYAGAKGAGILEGYPVEPKSGKNIPPAFAWTGIPSAFEKAGFKEVLRRSPTRPIMRIKLKP